MPKKINQVAEFHQLFNHPILEYPTIPSMDRCTLRYDLIKEELEELRDAYIAGDKVEVLDALCDLQYVLNGAILEFGMHQVIHPAFNEVHASNMTKECQDFNEARQTANYYENERDILTQIVPTEKGKYKVLRLDNDKTLKSINYTPVDLNKFV